MNDKCTNRFSRIDAQGTALAHDSTAPHVAVYDATTGLMWSADDVTKRGVNHDKATKACAELDLAGAKDWRLPTIEELETIRDRSRYSPAIDTAFFPTCKNDWYWSASPAAWSSSVAWLVDFGYGYGYPIGRDGVACVRAVRVAGPSGQ